MNLRIKITDVNFVGSWCPCHILCLSLGLMLSINSSAQTYFKELGPAPASYNLKVSHFNNGDVLIGDSDLAGLQADQNGKILLTRLDNCGNIVWSNSYERADEYLEFKDFEISTDGEIFVFGSAFRGFDELIFLLKVSNRGELIKFNLFRTETVDRFSYSIDLSGNKLMVYGLLLDFDTKKQGFVAIFDQGLNFSWGKKFTPFDSSGDAIICSDGGYMCWSGPYHYKLNEDGDLQWAKEARTDLNVPIPIAGPVEIPGGYIFQAYGNGQSLYYKFNLEGNLIWTSTLIPSTTKPAVMELSGTNIIATYSAPFEGKENLCQLLIDQSGNITMQRKLDVNHIYQSESLSQSLDKDGQMVILSNSALPTKYDIDVEDFIIQFDLNNLSTECLTWTDFNDQSPNSYRAEYLNVDTPIVTTIMTLEPAMRTTFNPVATETLRDLCDEPLAPNLITRDTMVDCGETWTVALPSSDFTWKDNPEAPITRELDTIGTYSASNRDCLDPIIYEFTLTKPDCECFLYLANAFSPNQDGINDTYGIQGDCSIASLNMQIFDRWGNMVFQGNHPNITWDGTTRGKSLPAGIYIVHVSFNKSTRSGASEKSTMVQDVMLIR